MNILEILGIHPKGTTLEATPPTNAITDATTPNESTQTQTDSSTPTPTDPATVQPDPAPGESTDVAVTADPATARVDDDGAEVNEPDNGALTFDKIRDAVPNLAPSEIPPANEVPGILGVLAYHIEYGELPKPVDER